MPDSYQLAIVFFLLMSASLAHGSKYECVPVDSNMQGHSLAISMMEEQIGSAPTEVQFCTGNRPRWVARWDVLETYSGWRKFSSVTCDDSGLQPRCRFSYHVVVPASHEVIDLAFDISLPRVKELFETAKTLFSESEISKIDFKVVADGGVWNEEAYGYQVTILNPPDFHKGFNTILLRTCNGKCTWSSTNKHGGGGVLPSSTDTRLRDLRRKTLDPQIDFLSAWGVGR